jgi:hypothetical protein
LNESIAAIAVSSTPVVVSVRRALVRLRRAVAEDVGGVEERQAVEGRALRGAEAVDQLLVEQVLVRVHRLLGEHVDLRLVHRLLVVFEVVLVDLEAAGEVLVRRPGRPRRAASRSARSPIHSFISGTSASQLCCSTAFVDSISVARRS